LLLSLQKQQQQDLIFQQIKQQQQDLIFQQIKKVNLLKSEYGRDIIKLLSRKKALSLHIMK